MRGNKLTSNRCKALEELSLKTKTKANDFSTNTIYNELDKLQANELSQLKVNEELILGDETSVGISSGKNIVENNKATNMVNNKTEKPCPDIFEQYPNLLSFLIENIIILKGNFQFPGIHLIDSKTNLREILNFAGAKSGKIILSPNSKTIQLIKNRIILEGSLDFLVNLITTRMTPSCQYLVKII